MRPRHFLPPLSLALGKGNRQNGNKNGNKKHISKKKPLQVYTSCSDVKSVNSAPAKGKTEGAAFKEGEGGVFDKSWRKWAASDRGRGQT